MVSWTRRELRFFTIYSIIIAFGYEVLGFTWAQLPWTPLAMIGTAVAFLIGFQSNAAYGRIWEARQIWGGIVNDSRSIAIMVIDMVNNDYCDQHLTENDLHDHKRTIIYRHFAWITALRYAMRSERPWESLRNAKANKKWRDLIYVPEFKTTLEDELEKYLSPEEKKIVLATTNKSAAIMKLQSSHLLALRRSGNLWEFSFLELQNKISDLIAHQGKSERIKNFPYPRQFATIGNDFVNLFILLLPFGVIPEFAKIGLNFLDTFPLVASNFVWLGIPFNIIICWIFNTMLRIGTVGENPFEGSVNDVPISTISRGIEIDLREMLGETGSTIPEQYPITMDCQM
ncbi:MAG: bestrophin family ion channel [Cyclobacteriaceae bacterium]